MPTMIVTGAANGLGKSIAEHAARSGYQVGVLDLAPEPTREVAEAISTLCERVEKQPELTPTTCAAVRRLITTQYGHVWKAKFDVAEPSALPPMRIQLKPGAVPSRVRRTYRWSRQ